jgi:nitrite reductase/ring-hydroxylating ferredoxin subunit
MKYVKLCKTDLLSDTNVKQCNKDGNEVLIVKLDGQFFCLSARCTHAGAPLLYSDIKEGVLICPWHGSRFKINNGEVLLGPADKPLTIYPHKIKNGYIFVKL